MGLDAELAGRVPTLAGLGYELVDAQASNRGRFCASSSTSRAASGRRLRRGEPAPARVLAVEGVDYDRLEVSSPGLDRPLTQAERFRAFRRAQGARCRMRSAGRRRPRRFVGVLREMQDGAVSMEVDGADGCARAREHGAGAARVRTCDRLVGVEDEPGNSAAGGRAGAREERQAGHRFRRARDRARLGDQEALHRRRRRAGRRSTAPPATTSPSAAGRSWPTTSSNAPPRRYIARRSAGREAPTLKIGDFIEEPLESLEFGRIGAQTAKQVILQKIRDAEREQILNDFLSRGDERWSPARSSAWSAATRSSNPAASRPCCRATR